MVSLITGGFVRAIAPTGVPPALAAATLSFCVGLWSLLFGLLNFGFVFELLSLPIVLGYVSGLAQVLIIAQFPPMLGLTGISPVFIQQMPEIIAKISQVKASTIGIAASSIVILVFFQVLGKKWGHRIGFFRFMAMQGSLFVIIVYTVISYVINKDRTEPMWSILGPISTPIPIVRLPNITLFQGLLLPSFALWIAINTEHVGMAKCYGHLNGYTVNASQEMVYLGITNTINSFLGGFPVSGGDLARTAVNSESGVRSPLGGVFTSITVFVATYVGSPFLQYLPQATIAAVILVATINQMPSMSNIGKYWKLSFTDFCAFLITFNATMLTTAETGIGLGLGIMVIYTLFRLMTSHPHALVSVDLEEQYSAREPVWWSKDDLIPAGIQVMCLKDNLIFVNAQKTRRHIVDSVYTFQTGLPLTPDRILGRSWNDRRDKRIEFLRRKAHVSNSDTFIPNFRALVLDLTRTSFVDASGMQALEDMKKELKGYGGPDIEIRFAGMSESVRRRFQRGGWTLKSPYEDGDTTVEGGAIETHDLAFEFLPHAIQHQLQDGSDLSYVFEKGDL